MEVVEMEDRLVFLKNHRDMLERMCNRSLDRHEYSGDDYDLNRADTLYDRLELIYEEIDKLEKIEKEQINLFKENA
jgi:hypothetical protein